MITELKRYGHISAIIPKENKHDYMRILPLIWLFPLNCEFQSCLKQLSQKDQWTLSTKVCCQKINYHQESPIWGYSEERDFIQVKWLKSHSPSIAALVLQLSWYSSSDTVQARDKEPKGGSRETKGKLAYIEKRHSPSLPPPGPCHHWLVYFYATRISNLHNLNGPNSPAMIGLFSMF